MSLQQAGEIIWGEQAGAAENRLLSLDSVTGKIYQHLGISLVIVDSFSSPGATPTGIGWKDDVAGLISCDDATDDIYRHTGFSSSITECFSSPGATPYGLVWAGSYLISSDRVFPSDLYKHTGFTSSFTESFCIASFGGGLAWDGFYILTGLAGGDNAICMYPPFAGEREIDCFSSPSTEPGGVAWDGVNILSSDIDVADIYSRVINEDMKEFLGKLRE